MTDVRGGEKAFLEEVEEVVKTHPAVDDRHVFGVPDERFGQRGAGVVALAPRASAISEELRENARTQLASY